MLNILITGCGGGGIGEQLTKVLRLSGLTYRLICTDTSIISKGRAETGQFAVLPPARDPAYLAELLALCEQERVQVLLPGSEPELRVMSDNRELIEAAGVFLPINPKRVIDICLDKSLTSEFFRNAGLHFPRSITVRSEADLASVDFFPAVLKPSVGAGGSANIMLAQSREELEVFGRYLLSIYPEYVIQEYVGTEQSEYTVGVLLDMRGGVINSIAMRRLISSGLGAKMRLKNRSSQPELGDYLAVSSGISQGEIVAPFELNRICEDIAVRLGATAAINIQCRYVDGKAYVFEINPRYSGTSSSRALLGYNELEPLLRQHFERKEPLRHQAYRFGYVLRGLQEFHIPSQD